MKVQNVSGGSGGFWGILHQAEMASMVLRWLAEDVTVHNDDILGIDHFSQSSQHKSHMPTGIARHVSAESTLCALPSVFEFVHGFRDHLAKMRNTPLT